MSVKVFDIVFDELLKVIEETQQLPWEKPWIIDPNAKSGTFGFAPINYITNKPYSGFNTMLLCMKRQINSYPTNKWAGFHQFKKDKIFVRKGQKASKVLAPIIKEVKELNTATGQLEIETKCVGFRYCNVWNLAQTTYKPEEAESTKVLEEDEEDEDFSDVIGYNELAETIIKEYETMPILKYEGNQACYSPAMDIIKIPERKQFNSQNEFYGTLYHECIHSTGASSRLNRFDKTQSVFASSSKTYSFEELVAEIGSCFLLSQAGITDRKVRQNSGAYLNGWLKQLKSDPQMLFRASIQAEKAAKYILGL